MSELSPEEQAAAQDAAAAQEAGNADAEKDAHIAELEAQVQALQAEVDASTEHDSAKDAEIKDLQTQLDAARTQASSAEANAASNVATAPQPVVAEKVPAPGLDVGQKEVQERVDAEEAQGFRGQNVDPTPNENYSMETPPDAPTPETDAKLAAEAKAAVDGNRLVNTDTPSNETAAHNGPGGSAS